MELTTLFSPSSLLTLISPLFLCFALYKILKSSKGKLPPGPTSIPFISNIHWLRKSSSDIEQLLNAIRSKYGSIITLHIAHSKLIFISSSDLTHKALIEKGAIFADRPPVNEVTKITSSNLHSIGSAPYGPLWRLLRRNFTSQLLHPSCVKSYSPARKWVLQILLEKLRLNSGQGQPVKVMEHFQYGIFCLLVFMCFGEKLDEKTIREIQKAQQNFVVNISRFNVLKFSPKFGKILFRRRWQELYDLRREQEDVLGPLIRSRREKLEQIKCVGNNTNVGYVDSLLTLTLPEEGDRKLTDGEIVSLCLEMLIAGTDTTATALHWIMANLVKHPEIQLKLFNEIKDVVSDNGEKIKEEDLQKLTYLKAVVLEGLRRHPPGHFLLFHAVSEDTQLDGYHIPKNTVVNFMVAEIGWDPKIWEDPMEFKPERFLGNGGVFDVTGNRELKMLPFGAGRRICPAYSLGMLHLEYFLANLVKEFEWTARVGDDIDLSEKQEFTTVMKYPLHTLITPRIK